MIKQLPCKLLRAALLFLLVAGPAKAQQRAFFTPRAALPTGAAAPAGIRAYRLYATDLSLLRAASMASGDNGARAGRPEAIALPMPDGSYRSFELEATAVLSPALAAENPGIRTYSGRSVDGAASAVLTLSDFGASAYIQTPEGGVYITPLSPVQPGVSVVARVRDYIIPEGSLCGLSDLDQPYSPDLDDAKTAVLTIGDNNKRTYDLVVATTGEYTSAAGGATGALARVTASVATLNAIYQRDLGVTFVLNSPLALRYTSASTDPYGAGPSLSSADLNANQTAIDAEVGTSGYDIGQVFGTQWSGGLAQLGSTCNSFGKARSASGLGTPIGPVFDGIVAHETGHQFDATHTHASNNGTTCSGAINASTGWEPGGGSTIMSYTNNCTGNFYQNNADLYFHAGNLTQMGAFTTNLSTGGSCPTTSASGNAIPTAAVGSTAYTIPHSTPFRLTLTSTDADGDTLTYTHEQYDAVGGTGTSTAPQATATSGPNFRSFPPSADSSRYLPNLRALGTGATTPYEVLPSVARTLNFRLAVRDNNTGVGHVRTEDIAVSTSSTGPFSVTSGTSAATLAANGTNTTTITWSNASTGTTCPSVNILFSRDGVTYPYVVLANTPNDGSQTITVPNLSSCVGRYMVECANNIFFNINGANQTITSSCAAEGTAVTPAIAFTAVQGSPALALTMSPVYGTTYSSPIADTVKSTDPTSSLASYSGGTCTNFGGNVTNYDAYTIQPTANGTYTFTLSGTFGIVLTLYEGTFSPTDPCQNIIAGSADGGTLSSSITATLCPNKSYTLVAGSFGGGFPTLPASYSVAFSGGGLASGPVNPGAGFNYSYAIVNVATGNVVQVQSSPNLSSASTFPAGAYRIYGISATSTAATLNSSYAGLPFTTLTSALYNQTSSTCGMISSNSRPVAISLALSTENIRFAAALTGRRSARASWTVEAEKEAARYVVERSYDGAIFEDAGSLPARASGETEAYALDDAALREAATEVHYRLRSEAPSGAVRYTPAVRLALQGAAGRSLRVVPNPVVAGTMGAEVVLPLAGSYTVSVVDAVGRTVYGEERLLGMGLQTLALPLPSLAAGVYTLRVAGAGAVLNARFVKSR